MQGTILLALMALDPGGAETHGIALARSLQRKGHRVLVASNGGALVRQLEAAGIEHVWVPLHTKHPLQVGRSYLRLRSLVRQENVALIHAHARIPGWISQTVARQTGVPLVTTFHGVYNPGGGLRYITRFGDAVIAVSDDVKRHLIEQFNVSAEKITVIPNGIDTNLYAPGPPDPILMKEFDLTGDLRCITYVSRLAGPRGDTALRLIGAARLLLSETPELRLLIIGEGDRLETIRQAAADLNQQAGRTVVTVTGARLDIERLHHLAFAAVGVGRSALEAMAVGKPVIIASEYGLQGVITPANFDTARRNNFSGRGTERAADEPALAAELRGLLQSPEHAGEYGAFARGMIQTHFSMDIITEDILKVYESTFRKETRK